MARIIGGSLVGIFVAMAIIALCESIGHAAWPPATGADGGPLHSPTSLAAVPLPALLSVVVGWFLGALGGGWVAGKIGRSRNAVIAVALVLLAATAYAFYTIAHPLWMMLAGGLCPIAGVMLAIRLARPGAVSPA